MVWGGCSGPVLVRCWEVGAQLVVGPAQRVRIHITNGGVDGDATGALVGFMLGASAVRPQSGRSSSFLGIVAGPPMCDAFDVIKAIEDGERAAQEGRPPCMWDWEQRRDAMTSAIHSQREEHLVAVADGAFGCGGASVGLKEGGPVARGA